MSDFDLNSYKIIKENPRYVTISGDIQNIGYEDNISICANGNLLRRGDKRITSRFIYKYTRHMTYIIF